MECLFILYGATSRNGKGTTMETFLRIMGDYGKTSKENSTNFNNAIQRFFPIQRKRPNGESGGPTTMLIGCRFLEKERGEPEEENAAFS